jgi:hypothetical protein
MVYKTQNYWVFGLCPSSGTLKTREHSSVNVVTRLSGKAFTKLLPRNGYPRYSIIAFLNVAHHLAFRRAQHISETEHFTLQRANLSH